MVELGASTVILIIVLSILVVFLWIFSCAICFYIGFNLLRNQGKASQNKNFALNNEPTKEEEEKLKAEKREIENFFKYDGSAQ